MSYVGLVETMLVEKEGTKQAVTRTKKATKRTYDDDDSMDTTPVPEGSPSSTTVVLRPLSNTFNVSESICAD